MVLGWHDGCICKKSNNIIILFKMMNCDIKYTQSLTFSLPETNNQPQSHRCQPENTINHHKIDQNDPQKHYHVQPHDNNQNGSAEQPSVGSTTQCPEQFASGLKPQKLLEGSSGAVTNGLKCRQSKRSMEAVQLTEQQQQLYILQLGRKESNNFNIDDERDYKSLYFELKNKFTVFKKLTIAYSKKNKNISYELESLKKSAVKQIRNKQQLHQSQIQDVNLRNEVLAGRLELAEQDLDLYVSREEKLSKEIQENKIKIYEQDRLIGKEKVESSKRLKIMQKDMEKIKQKLQFTQKQFNKMKRQLIEKHQILQKAFNLHNSQLQMSKKQCNRLSVDFQKTKRQKAQLQMKKGTQIDLLRNQALKSEGQKKALKDKVQKLEFSVSTMLKQAKSNEQKIKSLEKQNISLIEQVRQWKDSYQSKDDSLGKSQIELTSKYQLIDQLNRYLQVVHQQLGLQKGNFQQQEYLNRMQEQFINIKYFSDSVILAGIQTKKIFVHQTVCKFMEAQAFTTKLTYRYDPNNTTNFHNYFDHKPNLIIFVKLTNNVVIGGFTAHSFDPQQVVRPGKGFLFSLYDEKVFKMRDNPRTPVTSYDKYYFILGNAEIRIKTQQRKIFSNFGIGSSTFESGNVSKADFLKMNQGENNLIDVETYEIFELQLNQ